MDLVLAVGGTFAILWLCFQVSTRYPKHFFVFVVIAVVMAAWWTLHSIGRV